MKSQEAYGASQSPKITDDAAARAVAIHANRSSRAPKSGENQASLLTAIRQGAWLKSNAERSATRAMVENINRKILAAESRATGEEAALRLSAKFATYPKSRDEEARRAAGEARGALPG